MKNTETCKLRHAGTNGSQHTWRSTTVDKENWWEESLVKQATLQNTYFSFTRYALYVCF